MALAIQQQNQGTITTTQQIILDIQDNEVNPAITAHTQTPVDPLLANIVFASVVATFREQQHQYGHATQ